MVVSDNRMVHELPKILVACTESNFDPNAAVIWLGESLARFIAHAKAQMILF